MQSFDLEALKSGLGSLAFLVDYGFWLKFYRAARIIFMTLGFIFAWVSAWLFVQIWSLKFRLYVLEGRRAYKAPQKLASFEDEQKRITRKKWDDIVKKAESGGPMVYPVAIIEADVLLENSLAR